jgi:hypothetical protein
MDCLLAFTYKDLETSKRFIDHRAVAHFQRAFANVVHAVTDVLVLLGRRSALASTPNPTSLEIDSYNDSIRKLTLGRGVAKHPLVKGRIQIKQALVSAAREALRETSLSVCGYCGQVRSNSRDAFCSSFCAKGMSNRKQYERRQAQVLKDDEIPVRRD